MNLAVLDENGVWDKRLTVKFERDNAREWRWVSAFGDEPIDKDRCLSEAWFHAVSFYSEAEDVLVWALALRRLTRDPDVAELLREEIWHWPDQELANVAVGLCFEQTGYGLPGLRYCDYPALGTSSSGESGILYCAHHYGWHKEELVSSTAVGMPDWLSRFTLED